MGFGRRALPVCCLAAALASGGGCLVSTRSNVTYENDTARVPAYLLKEVQPGRTTRQWLLTHLGQPTRERRLGEHVSVLEYEHHRRKQGELSVFVIGSFESDREYRDRHYFVLEDDVVREFGRGDD